MAAGEKADRIRLKRNGWCVRRRQSDTTASAWLDALMEHPVAVADKRVGLKEIFAQKIVVWKLILHFSQKN
jgi:hypothetical protein